MPKKTVTTKEQIPKWYTKRIKGFSELTQQEALFEYEALKVRERARKYAKRQKIEYIPPKIVRPSTVIEPDVNFIRRIELPTIQEAVKKQAPIVSAESGLYDYEHEYWKEEHLPDYQAPHYEYYQSSWEDYEGDEEYFEYDEPEEEIPASRIIQEYYHPEPSTPEPEEPAHDIDDYWIDPNTGEAVLWEDIKYADAERAAIEFLEDLKAQLQQVADDTAISHSYYANGRTKSASQRNFYNQNIDRALQQVFDKIDSILHDDNKLQAFVAKHRGATNDWEALVMAASEYIADSYKSKGGDAAQIAQAARLNALLDAGPISLSEAMDFVDEAYDVDE